MPHDKHGALVEIGDTVTIRATIVYVRCGTDQGVYYYEVASTLQRGL